jgi:hypothetical protein
MVGCGAGVGAGWERDMACMAASNAATRAGSTVGIDVAMGLRGAVFVAGVFWAGVLFGVLDELFVIGYQEKFSSNRRGVQAS